ncbi:MAG: hypothetical protein CMP20_15300, partial [Rickettsiales bacterium]|nr:hypothetical protein [Rickettsiales bacterium]
MRPVWFVFGLVLLLSFLDVSNADTCCDCVLTTNNFDVNNMPTLKSVENIFATFAGSDTGLCQQRCLDEYAVLYPNIFNNGMLITVETGITRSITVPRTATGCTNLGSSTGKGICGQVFGCSDGHAMVLHDPETGDFAKSSGIIISVCISSDNDDLLQTNFFHCASKPADLTDVFVTDLAANPVTTRYKVNTRRGQATRTDFTDPLSCITNDGAVSYQLSGGSNVDQHFPVGEFNSKISRFSFFDDFCTPVGLEPPVYPDFFSQPMDTTMCNTFVGRCCLYDLERNPVDQFIGTGDDCRKSVRLNLNSVFMSDPFGDCAIHSATPPSQPPPLFCCVHDLDDMGNPVSNSYDSSNPRFDFCSTGFTFGDSVFTGAPTPPPLGASMAFFDDAGTVAGVGVDYLGREPLTRVAGYFVEDADHCACGGPEPASPPPPMPIASPPPPQFPGPLPMDQAIVEKCCRCTNQLNQFQVDFIAVQSNVACDYACSACFQSSDQIAITGSFIGASSFSPANAMCIPSNPGVQIGCPIAEHSACCECERLQNGVVFDIVFTTALDATQCDTACQNTCGGQGIMASLVTSVAGFFSASTQCSDQPLQACTPIDPPPFMGWQCCQCGQGFATDPTFTSAAPGTSCTEACMNDCGIGDASLAYQSPVPLLNLSPGSCSTQLTMGCSTAPPPPPSPPPLPPFDPNDLVCCVLPDNSMTCQIPETCRGMSGIPCDDPVAGTPCSTLSQCFVVDQVCERSAFPPPSPPPIAPCTVTLSEISTGPYGRDDTIELMANVQGDPSPIFTWDPTPDGFTNGDMSKPTFVVADSDVLTGTFSVSVEVMDGISLGCTTESDFQLDDPTCTVVVDDQTNASPYIEDQTVQLSIFVDSPSTLFDYNANGGDLVFVAGNNMLWTDLGGGFAERNNDASFVTIQYEIPAFDGTLSYEVTIVVDSLGASQPFSCMQTFAIVVEAPPPTGSCCFTDGSCLADQTEAECSESWTEGGVCDPNT